MKSIILTILLVISFPSISWDGYDYETGNYIEIGSGNSVSSGEEVEIYDYEVGEYRYVEVQGITSNGSAVEVEVYDYTEGEYRTFEMETD